MILLRYYYTLKYLQWRQIYWRLYYKLRSYQLFKAKVRLRTALAIRNKTRSWQQPIEGLQSLMAPEVMVFLNQQHNIASATVWNDAQIEKLWLYNLHYFADLNAVAANSRTTQHKQLIQRWIDENPFPIGNGWEPYPISLRIINWVKWLLAENNFDQPMLASLCLQTRWLRKNLEYHLLGNHLLANAKALIFAGLFFSGSEADAWFNKGMQLIQQEIAEQILADGGHFELSPMYHSLILEDLLDLVNILSAYSMPVPAYLTHSINRMFVWLSTMSHADNAIALFNDAAFDIAPKFEQLVNYAQRLDIIVQTPSTAPLRLLENSGYARLQNACALLIADVGAVGPDYLPGHAHADTLSFELSLQGQRVIVNSGTSCYGVSAERARQRGTAAHNTVVIDNNNSSDVWAGFRVGQRAKIVRRNAGFADGVAYLSAAHDGYKSLAVMHQRTWKLRDNSLIIIDELIGNTLHEVACLLHLHPAVKLQPMHANSWKITFGAGLEAQINIDPSLTVEAIASSYHPQFGISLPNYKLVAVAKAKLPLRLQHEIIW